jgi:hypothetical protein
MLPDHRLEETLRNGQVAMGRHQDVDDLAELIDRPVHVAPHAGDLHVGLIHEPAVADGVAAGPGAPDEQRGEPLHPPDDRDVVDVDPRSARSSSTSRYDSP